MALALKTGTSIGGFDVIDVIGRGGFGITYKASDQTNAKIYAIKEYLPDGMSTRSDTGGVSAISGQDRTYKRGLDAFMTEANILKELPQRQGLVRVRGAFEKFGTAYCVMEFIEGDSLDHMASRLIRRYGYLPAELVTDLAVAICWALHALHAENLIHRDVKPANIMLRRTGEPVLIDFGAARRLSRRGTKETIFTRKYASIEQLPTEMTGFGRHFDEGPWSDLYSLSVVLYELIAKTVPPDAATRSAAVLSGAPDPYVPMADIVRDQGRSGEYDARLLTTIDDGCALLPQERIRDAESYAKLIAPDALDDLTAKLQVYESGEDTHQSSGKSRKSRAFFWLCVIALLAATAVYWYNELFPRDEVF